MGKTMKIFKYLLSYVGLFIALLAIFALIYFRVYLFPSGFNKPIDSTIAMLEDKFNIDIPEYQPANGAHQKPLFSRIFNRHNEGENLAEPENTETTEVAQVPQVVEEELVVVVKEKTPQESTENIENTSPADDIEQQTAEDKVDNKDEPVAAVEPTAPVKEEPAAAVETSPLNQARNAYWSGNLGEAEMLYIQLTAGDDVSPDVYGELGNIYYAQGKWKEAGNAYYEAAIRLIEHKQYAQVNYLLRVIQGLNPESAKKLQDKISG